MLAPIGMKVSIAPSPWQHYYKREVSVEKDILA
jgi:hypothetical protein